ncbi:serine/threonine protein kinase, partial [Myxococcota bacterium]|nr:serine/threonine protein kinase [Myxococcota bacterium]
MNGPAAFGPYLLDRRVGAGGMAEVFAARRVHAAGVEQRVVIKRILPRLAGRPEQVALFLDEARVSAALCHPNIAQVHDFGEIDGAWFLSLEQVDGPDLRGLLRVLAEEGEQLPAQLALYVVHEVLSALEHAHGAHLDGRPLGIVHRDVCPANVVVSRQGRVKLVDFGVACSALGGASRDAVHGHIAYMSPEQVSGQPVDPRSDLFSVGVLLHELLTGRRLFRGVDAADSARRVRQRPVAAPSALSAQAPPELDALVLRALSRAPEGRFPDAGSFRRALREHMDLRVIDDCPGTLAAVVRRLEGALAGAGTATLAPVEGGALAHTVQVRPRATRSEPDTASLSLPRRRRTTLGVALGTLLALALAVGVAWQATRPPTPVALARSPAQAPLAVGAAAPVAVPQPPPAVARPAPPSPPGAPPPHTAARAAPP